MKHLYYGWILVIIAACVLVTASFVMYAFGIFVVPLAAEFNWDRGVISGAYALHTLLIGPFGIFAGKLADRYGPRIVVTINGLLVGAGFLLVSQISSLWQLYLIWGLFMGVGGAFSYTPIMSTIPRWFAKKRGIAIGVTAAGFGLGGVISPLISQCFISSYGWRSSFAFLGLIVLIVTVTLAQFMKQSPQQIGLSLYGEGDAVEDGPPLALAGGGISFVQAIKTRSFWLFAAILGCFYFCFGGIIIHVAPMAIDVGILATAAAGIVSVIAGASIIGRLLTGFVIERIGSSFSLLACLIIAIVSFGWLLFAEESWMFYTFAVIFGFAYGGMVTMETFIASELFGISSLGMIFGGIILFTTIGQAIGPPLAGSIFDVTGSYDLALLTYILAGTIAVILSLILRWQRLKGLP